MQKDYPLPKCETERLEALRRYRVLDGGRQANLDDIARLAAFICDTPMSAVTIIGADTQRIKAGYGMDAGVTPRSDALCNHTIVGDGVLVVEDAAADGRFASHPAVCGGLKVRFYAGAPLVTPDFYNLGALCVVDTVPRQISAGRRHALASLAALVMTELNLRETSADLAATLKEVKVLRDFLPTCSYCGEIRNEKGEWRPLGDYITEETTSRFSHGVCPKCAAAHFPELYRLKAT